ncbi:autotransporter domain-containing protein [Phyllobacterium endophyticum]|nr:autotransporter domain-containing protein [Phyllobacterium endophyticum]
MRMMNKSDRLSLPATSPRLLRSRLLLLSLSSVAIIPSQGLAQTVIDGGLTRIVIAPETWELTDSLIIGDATTGDLVIEAGGKLKGIGAVLGKQSGSTGTVFVTGPGSEWQAGTTLGVGDSGNGKLTIADGGKVVLTSQTVIGATIGGSGELLVTGQGANLTTGGTEGFTIGHSGKGVLTVEQKGTLNSNSANIGGFDGSNGTATVRDAGSLWTVNGSLAVGGDGSGELTIAEGGAVRIGTTTFIGAVNNTDTPGRLHKLVVTDKGSSLSSRRLIIGTKTLGELSIMGGATLTTTGSGTAPNMESLLGRTSGGIAGSANVTIDGAGSKWTAGGTVIVGETDSANIKLSRGGEFSNALAVLGRNANSSGTVTVTGNSKWDTTGALTIGQAGFGVFNADTDGAITSGSGILARDAGSAGVLTLKDRANWTVADAMTIGQDGDATLNIDNDARLSSATTAIATNAGSKGVLNINGAQSGFVTNSITFGAGDGTINFTGDRQINAAIAGKGKLNFNSGTFVLASDSGGFTGTTTVSDKSILRVNNTLAGALHVLGGGFLGGIGTVGTTRLDAGSILAPGNSVGTIHVNGDLLLASRTTYQVELNSTASDLTQITGTATLTGARVQVVAVEGQPDPAGYTILTAAGGLNGTTFQDVSTELAFYKPELLYPNGTDVRLVVKRNDLKTPIIDPHGGGGSELDKKIKALETETAPRTVEQLPGRIHPALAGVLLEDSRFVRDAIGNRLRTASDDRVSTGLPVLAFGEDVKELPADVVNRFGLWSEGFGSWADIDSDGGFSDAARSLAGFMIGGDAGIGEYGRAGIVAGYSKTDLKQLGLAAEASVDSYNLGLYGGAEYGRINFRSGAAYSWHNIEVYRQVRFMDRLERLGSDYDAGTAQVFGEIGYRAGIGAVALEPFANLAYARIHTDPFAENAALAGLASNGADNDLTVSTLGLHISGALPTTSLNASFRGTIGWRHTYADAVPSYRVNYTGLGLIGIDGLRVGRDAVVIDAGIAFALGKNTTLDLSYDGLFAEGLSDNAAKAALSVRF